VTLLVNDEARRIAANVAKLPEHCVGKTNELAVDGGGRKSAKEFPRAKDAQIPLLH